MRKKNFIRTKNLNHTYLIDEHHKDRNRDNNTKDNAIDICVFCHLHGIHQQSFKIRTIPDEQFENDFGNLLELVKEYDEYETYKFKVYKFAHK